MKYFYLGLALANNTLMLPRRESQDDEEDDFTRVPVQTFTYNQDEPVNKQKVTQTISAGNGAEPTKAGLVDMDMTRASNKTVAAPIDMDMTKVSNKTVAAPIDMDMTKVSNKTVAAPMDMDMTRASNKTLAAPMDMDMTRASNKTVAAPMDMDMTRASNKTVAAPLDMDMTRASNETVAAPIDIDMTRASNKTIAAPMDMDMTRASNKTVAAPMDMDMTRASNKTVAAPLDMEETKVSNKTVAATIDMEMTRANNKTVSSAFKDIEVPKSYDKNLEQDPKAAVSKTTLAIEPAQSLQGFSPEPTMVVGGMMHQGLNNMHTEDITNFMPVGESTRAFHFQVHNPVPRTAGIFEDGDDITNFLPGGESTRAVPKLPGPNKFDFGDDDVTSFVPGGESTRAIPRLPAVQNFDLGDVTNFVPGGESTRALPKLPVVQNFDFEDVTSFVPGGESTRAVPRLPAVQNFDLGDVTSFVPGGESTRAVPRLPATRSLELGDDVTSFIPKGTSTQMIDFRIPPPQAAKVNEMPKSPDFGDITSFAPRIESTRAIKFPIPMPGKNDVEGIDDLNLSPIGKGIPEVESCKTDVPQEDVEKKSEKEEEPLNAQEDDEVTFEQKELQPMKNISEQPNEPSLQKTATEEFDDTFEKNDHNNDSTLPIDEQDNEIREKENMPDEIIVKAGEHIESIENNEDQVREIIEPEIEQQLVNNEAVNDEKFALTDQINDNAIDDESKIPENNDNESKTNARQDNVNSLKRPSDLDDNNVDQGSSVKIQKTENLYKDNEFVEQKDIEKPNQENLNKYNENIENKDIEKPKQDNHDEDIENIKHKEIEKPKQEVVKTRKSTKVRKSELPREIRKSMLFAEEMDIFQDLKWWLDQTVSF